MFAAMNDAKPATMGVKQTAAVKAERKGTEMA